METFSALLAICADNSLVTGEFPAQRPVARSFDVFFDLRLINCWVNNGDPCDLRRHRAHYDVIVMRPDTLCFFFEESVWRHNSREQRGKSLYMDM